MTFSFICKSTNSDLSQNYQSLLNISQSVCNIFIEILLYRQDTLEIFLLVNAIIEITDPGDKQQHKTKKTLLYPQFCYLLNVFKISLQNYV